MRVVKTFIYSTIIFAIIFAITADADRASSANKRGIKAFDNQDYDESVEHFTDAIVERPGAPELRFNRGTALSALNRSDEALKELMSAAARLGKSSQSAAAYFNAGNTLFADNNVEAAIEEYKRAVKLDQSSEDIRHNLELALLKLNQQKKNQDQNQNNDSEEKENGGKDDRQQKKEQEEKDEQQSDKTREPEKGEQQDQNQQQSKQQDNEVLPMTPEEAQRLLDAINDDEKKALSQRYMQMKTNMRQGDDW